MWLLAHSPQTPIDYVDGQLVQSHTAGRSFCAVAVWSKSRSVQSTFKTDANNLCTARGTWFASAAATLRPICRALTKADEHTHTRTHLNQQRIDGYNNFWTKCGLSRKPVLFDDEATWVSIRLWVFGSGSVFPHQCTAMAGFKCCLGEEFDAIDLDSREG